jgi:hypothetical protein
MTTCQNDSDISSNADEFQKHTHKIKGLAPMMGKLELGNFSSMLDSILKKIMGGITIDGIFNILNDSIFSMNQSMIESDNNLDEIKIRISKILSTLN